VCAACMSEMWPRPVRKVSTLRHRWTIKPRQGLGGFQAVDSGWSLCRSDLLAKLPVGNGRFHVGA
jgi:hypothetical protein